MNDSGRATSQSVKQAQPPGTRGEIPSAEDLGGLRICRRARPRPSGYPGVGRMRLCQRASQCNFFLAAAAQATYNESIIANGWPAIELPLSLTKIRGM